MPMATYIGAGRTVDYTPAADTAAGDVVQVGDLVGVAPAAIKANAPGSLAVTGVYDMPKQAALAIAAGVFVFWDNAAKVVTTTAGANKLLGKALRAALAADATVRVRLVQ